MKLTDEEAKTLTQLEESIKALRRQTENERAFPHHVLEAAQTVETDAKWFVHLLQKR